MNIDSNKAAQQDHPEVAADSSASLPEWLRIDWVRVAIQTLVRWRWPLLAGVLGAVAGWFVTQKVFGNSYWAETQLIRYALPNSYQTSENGEAYRPLELAEGTIIGLMMAPTLLEEVGAIVEPPISASELSGRLKVRPERKTDLIRITLTGTSDQRQTAQLLNHYCDQVVQLTRKLQQAEAADLSIYLESELRKLRRELETATKSLAEFTEDSGYLNADEEIRSYLHQSGNLELKLESARIERVSIDGQIEKRKAALRRQNPVAIKLEEARARLQALLVNYTEANPKVLDQQSVIRTLEAELAVSEAAEDKELELTGSQLGDALYLDILNLESRRDALESEILQLSRYGDRLKEKLTALPTKGRRYAELKARIATLRSTESLLAARHTEARMFAENSPGYYRSFSRVSADHVTAEPPTKKRLAVAVAGGMFCLGGVWLFLLLLELFDSRVRSGGDLRKAANLRIIARFPDNAQGREHHDEVYRTWLRLEETLPRSGGGLVCGFISTEPSPAKVRLLENLADCAREREWQPLVIAEESTGARSRSIQEALSSPESPPRSAVLVDLTAQDLKETVQTASRLPNLIVLADGERTERRPLIRAVEAFRLAGCRMIGAIMNGEPALVNRIARLLPSALAVAVALNAQCAGAVPLAPERPVAGYRSSAPAQLQRAKWQRKFTLGPGDVLNFAIYGRDDANRRGVAISPDGRISYLQAQNVMAAGLSIDELRAEMNERLSKLYRNARVIVTPHTFTSKKFFLLGSVVDQGAYHLTHGMTILEAVAQARGLATGLYHHNTVELADLPRCFLVRDGKRLPIDFVRLFNNGDLTQNVLLEPDDFLYFPSSGINEVYVLGHVNFPGAIGISGNSTALSVIAVQAGFKDQARRGKILIVRGSLNAPKTFVLDAKAVLAGRERDFVLEPKDIVYVPERPTARLEELTDLAVRAFIGASVSTWTGGNIGPLIKKQVIPDL